MKKKYTNSDLWDLSNEEIIKLAKGKSIKIVLNNKKETHVYIENILGESYYPHKFSGFITSEKQTIYLQAIDYIELL